MIRIFVVGEVKEGKSAVADVIRRELERLGAQVGVQDFDSPGRTLTQSENIIRNIHPSIIVEVVLANREGHFKIAR